MSGGNQLIGKLLVAFIAICCLVGVVYAADSPSTSASPPILKPGPTPPYVRAYAQDDNGQATIHVGALDDPANPYKGQYTKLDYRIFEGYSSYIVDQGPRPNYTSIQLLTQQEDLQLKESGSALKNFITGAWVKFDPKTRQGWMIPMLSDWQVHSSVPTTLGDQLSGATKPVRWTQPADIAKFCSKFYYREDEPAFVEYQAAVAQFNLSIYPQIADWMVNDGATDSQHVFLPDGGMAIITPVGNTTIRAQGPDRTNMFRRYDAEGRLIKEVKSSNHYVAWSDEVLNPLPREVDAQYRHFYEHPSASGRPMGKSNNEMNLECRYTVFANDNYSDFLAVWDHWEGKLLTSGDLKSIPMPSYPDFQPVPHDELVRLYQLQQGAPKLQASK